MRNHLSIKLSHEDALKNVFRDVFGSTDVFFFCCLIIQRFPELLNLPECLLKQGP